MWKRYVLLGVVLAIFLAGNYCGQRVKNNPGHSALLPGGTYLMPDEKERVTVDFKRNRIAVLTPSGVKETTGARKAVITVKNDGTVVVVARSYGLCLEPGLGAAFGDGPGLTLDLQLAYWHSAGVLVGTRVYPKPTGYIAASYSLEAIHIANTSLFLGIGLGREVLGGVRVAF